MIQPSRWHLTLVQAALVFTLWSAGCTGQALTDPQDKAALLSFKEAAALDPQVSSLTMLAVPGRWHC